MVLLKMGCAYILTIGKYKHKYLAWVLKYDREWLVEWAIPACDIPEDIEIVDAAFAVQETGLGPNTPRLGKTPFRKKYNPFRMLRWYIHYLRHHRHDPKLCDTCYHYLYTRVCFKYGWLVIDRVHWCGYYAERQLSKAHMCVWYHQEFSPKTCIACLEEGGGQ